MHFSRWTRGVGRGSADTLGESLFQWFSTLVALGVVGVLVLIAILLFFEAEASIGAFGWSFLGGTVWNRSEEHTSELQSRPHLVCRLLLAKKNKRDDEAHKPQTGL